MYCACMAISVVASGPSSSTRGLQLLQPPALHKETFNEHTYCPYNPTINYGWRAIDTIQADGRKKPVE